jgi:hypothetical protein
VAVAVNPLQTSFVESERLTSAGEFRGVPAFVLDVPETIPQLGYGSHQFFRYYGKFPSVVAAEIIAQHARAGRPVLDCYAGSGTTLVEAQRAGLASFGVDINPLAVLASNVKTSYPNETALRAALDQVLHTVAEFDIASEVRMPTGMSASKLDKWFRPEVQRGLAAIRDAVKEQPQGQVREFLLTSFLGIVRRVSNAYDGEVRPHVNPDKGRRAPDQAFAKKAREMIAALYDINAMRPAATAGACVLGDNRESATYARLLRDERPGLVVAHPPYLNSFNYLQVFSLEFAWAEDFDEIWDGMKPEQLRAAEHRAWPATDDVLKAKYYADFRATMLSACEVASTGARVAVVIGDATIRGALEPVHQHCWDILLELGLQPEEIWFRTTHYGIGKYAYSSRADYHGDAAKKRDAILFFSKP